MKKYALFLFLLLLPGVYAPAHADTATKGKQGLQAVKRCIMENSTDACYDAITPQSIGFFDRLTSYKLMPCLPTNFTYKSETNTGDWTIVKAILPHDNNRSFMFKLAFITLKNGLKLDVPETLRIGLGETWENKMHMAESLFLIIRANAGGNLSCDQITRIADGMARK